MIDITDIAKDKIIQKIHQRGYGIGIRIGIRTTGCSGLAYTLEFVDKVDSTDHSQDIANYTLFVSKRSIPYLQGMTVDYVYQGLNEGFEFRNPNERNRCGCGESFTV